MRRRDFLKLIAVSPLTGLLKKEPTEDEIISAINRMPETIGYIKPKKQKPWHIYCDESVFKRYEQLLCEIERKFALT